LPFGSTSSFCTSRMSNAVFDMQWLSVLVPPVAAA